MTKVNEEAEVHVLSVMAKEIFEKLILPTFESRKEYGPSWLKRRMIYFTERMASKMERVRNLENNAINGIPPMNEGITAEIKDTICLGLMALIRLREIGDCPIEDEDNCTTEWALKYFGIREK